MFFHWSEEKDAEKRAQYGFGFAEVELIFDSNYYSEPNEGYLDQYLVVGFVGKVGGLYTVACEDRVTRDGREYVHLATFWKSSKRERELYEEKY
jgi:uncharacterized DUF497 family protein